MGNGFIDELFDVQISDGIVAFTSPDGSRFHTSLRLFRMQNALIAKVIAEYDARQADVVPIRKRQVGGHAASS